MSDLLSQHSPTQSRLLVLLLTDVVESTGIQNQLKAFGFLPMLQRHDKLLRDGIDGAGGQIHRDTGDGVLASFDTPSDAVRGALLIQWKLGAEPWPDGKSLSAGLGSTSGRSRGCGLARLPRMSSARKPASGW